MTATTTPSQCLTCINTCGVLVEVEDGRVSRVSGDHDSPISAGYTCVKGRAQPTLLYSEDRLMQSQRRRSDGTFESVASSVAIHEIGERLTTIVERYGSQAVALYFGTSLNSCLGAVTFASAFMNAIGSSLQFSTNTIDKGGRDVAAALHGTWMAPRQAWSDPDVALLLGINPLISYQGFPIGHPGKWLSKNLERGMTLIVVDPRRTDIAKRAHHHLQTRPGSDVLLLAALLHVILAEGLGDRSFVAAHTRGSDKLRVAVQPFSPESVAAHIGVDSEEIVNTARLFGQARRGFAVAGTGPHMTGQGTLAEYLLLNLEALCGHYLRVGELVPNAGSLIPTISHVAQAANPRPAVGLGEQFRVRGLTRSAAGVPAAALPDEILLPGDGQIRALICVGGNPAAALPGTTKAVAALRSLDLLVSVDPWMSETARLAHYVIAPTMWPEAPSISLMADQVSLRAPGYGLEAAYARYSPAVVEPPPGSDVLPDWLFFFRLARQMGIELEIAAGARAGQKVPSSSPSIGVDMAREPSHEEVLDMITAGSRIPLSEVRRHPHGAMFPDPELRVEAAEPGWTGRLDLANPDMLADLELVPVAPVVDRDYPFRMIPRRMQHVHNSSCHVSATNKGRYYNPAFMNPADLTDLGLEPGALVELRSPEGRIVAVAESDATVGRGLVSITHCFGDLEPETERANPRLRGANVNWLTSNDLVYDHYTGQPLMTNIAIAVAPVEPRGPL